MKNQDFRFGLLGLEVQNKPQGASTMPSHLDRWKASAQAHRATMDRSRMTTACAEEIIELLFLKKADMKVWDLWPGIFEALQGKTGSRIESGLYSLE